MTSLAVSGDRNRVASQPNRLRTLGGLQLLVNGIPVTRWRAGRARQLFQVLAANPGECLSKDRLIESVWGSSTARRPDVGLKVAVCTLRSALMAAHQQGGGSGRPGVWIGSRRGGYLLQLADTSVDVAEFEAAVAAADSHARAGRHELASRGYRRAVSIYTGPFLPECADGWVTVRRELLQDRLLMALEQLATDARAQGDASSLLRWHERILDVDPCREESYRELIRWHGAAGQLWRVQHWYSTCVEQLRTRLDLAPAVQTRQAFAYAMTRGRDS